MKLGGFAYVASAGALVGALALSSCLDSASDSPARGTMGPGPVDSPGTPGGPVPDTGNGSLSGPHYNLNLIGVPRNKTTDMSGNQGHRIFVVLEGNTRILLSEGEFGVGDANGTDGSASFTLPVPDADNDGITTYSVYARALGTPGGRGTITTCGEDPVTGEVVCSTLQRVFVRESGRSRFDNVSRELLYVFVDLDGDGTVERVPLFDDRLQDYFWEYDNNRLKLVQLRFYMQPTNVNP